MRRILWSEEAFPKRASFDVAVSRAVLQRVSAGALAETLRLHQTGDIVAFSALDRAQPGFAAAVAAARKAGFEPTLRLAGGRAAVFHRQTLAFAWSCASREPRRGIHERFREVAAVIAEALASLGVDARVGEVPGEYCPGEYSVNAGGRTKLVGLGQRLTRHAAHVGGVIVVSDSQRVRAALEPVYAELGLAWDPARVGSVADEIGEVSLEDVAGALRARVAARAQIKPSPLDADTLALAERLEPDHQLSAP